MENNYVRMSKSIENICKNNLSFYPMPHQYILHQNKHIPDGDTSLLNKARQLEAFIIRHHGEFEILSGHSLIIGDKREIIVYFVCDITAANLIDECIKK